MILNKYKEYSYLTILIIIIAIVSISVGNYAGYLFLSLLLFLTFILLYSFTNDKKLIYIIIFSILLKCVLILFHNFISSLPGSDADAELYEYFGWIISQYILGDIGQLPEISPSYFFSYWIGILYVLFGRLALVPELINGMLGVVLILLIYKITYRLTNNINTARFAAFIIFLFPLINLYSVLTMREIPIIFFFVLSFYFLLKYNDTSKISFILLSLLSLLISTFFHDSFIFITAVYIVYFVSYDVKNKKVNLFMKRNIFIIPFVLGIGVFFFSFLTNKLPDLSTLLSSEFISDHVARRSRDRASYLANMRPSNIIELIVYTPIRMIYFLFTPFPWMLSDPKDLIGIFDSFLYWILGFYSIKGLKVIKIKNKSIYYLVISVILVFLFLFGWGTSNYGAAMRHRTKISWLLIVISSIGYMNKRNSRSSNFIKIKDKEDIQGEERKIQNE